MSNETMIRIAQIVSTNDVTLFMKGTALFPQCGFSSKAILQDPEVREGIKAFSDWPTIPQLYVKGEFIGGSDIMMEMYEAGELAELMEEKDVARS
jgi:monothiol glutaredoxin